ncbi:MAG: phosphopantetheine-binding protein [Desulfobulbaceae bacterium]|nr:phosphopantetheine-binding protein [Desulfobulbaceae bacterium]
MLARLPHNNPASPTHGKMNDIKREIKELLVHGLRLQTRPEDISDTMPLFDDGLGLDSLDAVELVVLVNKQFGVQIKDMNEGKAAFGSVASLAAYIKEKQGS